MNLVEIDAKGFQAFEAPPDRLSIELAVRSSGFHLVAITTCPSVTPAVTRARAKPLSDRPKP